MKEETDNLSFWERNARFYTSFMKKNDLLFDKLTADFSFCLDSTMSVLEAGCGTGQLTRPLASKVRTLLATDFSPKMIAEARGRSHPTNVTYKVADVTALPFADASFDAVVIANTLHVMPCPEKALAEILRVLRPGGFLIAPTFVFEGKPSRKLFFLKHLGFRIFHRWNYDSFCDFVAEQGFALIKSNLLPADPLPVCDLVARKSK